MISLEGVNWVCGADIVAVSSSCEYEYLNNDWLFALEGTRVRVEVNILESRDEHKG